MEKSEKIGLFTVLFAIIAVIAITFLTPGIFEKPSVTSTELPSAGETPSIPVTSNETAEDIMPTEDLNEGISETAENETVETAEISTVTEQPPVTETTTDANIPLETLKELIALCADKTEGTQKDNCLQELAFEKNRIDLCNELAIFSKEECIKNIAVTQDVAEYCKDINSAIIRDDCYYSIASSKSDVNSCKKISSSIISGVKKRDSCFDAIAKKTMDFEYCDFISQSYSGGLFYRDNCYWHILNETKNPLLCEKFLSKNRKEECVNFLGLQITSVPAELTLSVCSSLNDLNQFTCYKELAVKDNNYLICDYLSDANFHRICMFTLINEIDANSSVLFCEKIIFADKDDCFEKMAFEKNDATLCALISDTTEKEDCYYELAIKIGNTELCKEVEKNIIQPFRRDDCFNKIAFNVKDANVCESINTEEKYYSCYYDIAVNLKSYTVCNTIKRMTHIQTYSNYPLKQICFKNYAIETGNQAACEPILITELKQACINKDSNFGIINPIS